MSKAIDLMQIHDEKDHLLLTQLVRKRLVATIEMERNVTVAANGAFGRILQRIYTGARSRA